MDKVLKYSSFKDYCKTNLTPIHGNKMNIIFNLINDVELNNIIEIYKTTDCLRVWNKIQSQMIILKNYDEIKKNININFLTSFFVSGVQNYMEHKSKSICNN
jgi:hypothetical protein